MAARKNNAAPPREASPEPTPAPAPAALGPPPAAELEFVEKLAADLIGQLGPQLQQLGHGSPVLLYGLAAAAKVVEVTARSQLEQLTLEYPERAAEFEAQWVLVLQRREQYEHHAAEQARASAPQKEVT